MRVEKIARHAMRFPLAAPVAFWWSDENGIRRNGEGSCRDISENGVFVFSPVCPSVGSSIKLTVSIDGLADTTCIDFAGWVSRSEAARDGKAGAGFAVSRIFR
jgi:hypothetical protein